MSKVLITGAAGFLGRRLLAALLEECSLTDRDGSRRKIEEIFLADIVEPPLPTNGPGAVDGVRVTAMRGDLSDRGYLNELCSLGFDSLFHLASQLTLQTESNPAASYAINVDAFRNLIERAENFPKVVFTSSLAVFGGALPSTVSEGESPSPTTSYGSHKAINELLLADGSRRGTIDGRSLRLPIVLTRPGATQPVVSDQVASIIREVLNDVDVSVPLAPETTVPLASAGTVVRALLTIHDLPASRLPPARAVNLPALTISVSDMADAARQTGGAGVARFWPDSRIQAIVEGWPRHFDSDHAEALGIRGETDIRALIEDYLVHKAV